MKKILLVAGLILGCATFNLTKAQVRVGVNINIGSQPDWGPVGYDYADYYYMPDIDAYYSVPAHEFVYFDRNVWVHAPALPPRYRYYDFYHSYKVVVNQPNPWMHADVYRTRYATYRGRRDQVVIRDSRDERYRRNWGHHEEVERFGGPGNSDWGHSHGRGHDHDDHGRGHGRGHRD